MRFDVNTKGQLDSKWFDPLMAYNGEDAVKVVICGNYLNLNKITKI